MELDVKNFLRDLLEAQAEKMFLTLLENPSAKIERIVSHSGTVALPEFWYDQPGDEWVIVLRGSATLEFADGKTVDLGAGDYLEIARHVRHRVARTD